MPHHHPQHCTDDADNDDAIINMNHETSSQSPLFPAAVPLPSRGLRVSHHADLPLQVLQRPSVRQYAPRYHLFLPPPLPSSLGHPLIEPRSHRCPERSFDTIPNFTAADCLRETGIGRNQFIDIMNKARSKVRPLSHHCFGGWKLMTAPWVVQLMWRVNRSLVKELLPSHPLDFPLHPWWLVCVVNLSTEEYRVSTHPPASSR